MFIDLIISTIEDIYDDLGPVLIYCLIAWGVLVIGLGIALPIVLHSKAAKEGKKSKGTAYLLFFFLNGLAAHRFYAGKAGTAILYVLTGKFFGVGYIIDLFMTGSMIDEYNRKVDEQNRINEQNRVIQQNMQAMQMQMMGNVKAQPQMSPAPQMQQSANLQVVNAAIVGVAGEYAGTRIPIDGTGVTLGRSGKYSQLVLGDPNVSGKHCTIRQESGQIVLYDHSSNGTYRSNGSRFQRDSRIVLNNGEMFYLANSKNMFRIEY